MVPRGLKRSDLIAELKHGKDRLELALAGLTDEQCGMIGIIPYRSVTDTQRQADGLSRCLQDRKMRVAQARLGKRLGGTGQGESRLATTPIVKEIYIESMPGTVLEFLTNEKKMKRWLTDAVMRSSFKSDGKLRVRLKGEEIQRATMTILVNPERAGASLSKDTIWGENSWPFSVIEIEVRPEGSGTRLKLRHAHLPTS